jgi:TolA-binding protein
MNEEILQLQKQIEQLSKKVVDLSSPKVEVKQDTILTDQEKKKIVDSLEYNAQVTLTSGTATISNGRFSPNSIALATPQTNRTLVSGMVTVPQTVCAICTGGECTITSTDNTDTRVINVKITY